MSTEAIYSKYWAALMDVDAVMVPADTAIALALRLAIGDAYGAGVETCSGMDTDLAAIVASQDKALPDALDRIDPLREERNGLQAQVAILEEELDRRRESGAAWVAEIDSLRQQLAQLDADNADLLNKVHQAQSVIAVGAFDSLHTNGNDVDPTTTPAWTRNHPAWEGMTDEQRIAVFELHTDRVKFGELSMELRTEILARVLRHMMNDASARLTMAQFDQSKPQWMPLASGLVKLFGGKWPKVLDLAAAPATA